MPSSYLNTLNIQRSTAELEYHPLIPFLPVTAKVLFLGSFPPQRKRWSMDFYYPNFQNDHWRIEGQVFFGDKNHFVDLAAKRFKLDEIIEFCRQHGLAFFDTATAVRRLRDNASDQYLDIVEPTDIRTMISQLPHLRAIVTTGELATATACSTLGISTIPKVGSSVPVPYSTLSNLQITLHRLPSSSRAYPLAFERKVEAYRQMFLDENYDNLWSPRIQN